MDKEKLRSDGQSGTAQTSSVWSYPEGCSPYGLYQSSGNVWEWCADYWEKDAYQRYNSGDLEPPHKAGDYRVRRGGSWYSYAELLPRTLSACFLANECRRDLGFRPAITFKANESLPKRWEEYLYYRR